MGKNRLTYAVSVVAFLLLVLFLPNEMTYFALYTLLLLPVISLVMFLLTVRQIHLSGALSVDFVQKGELAEFVVTVHNRGIFPLAMLEFCLSADRAFVFAEGCDVRSGIRLRAKKKIVCPIMTKHCGLYHVWVEEIKLYDFLGLFCVRQAEKESVVLTVLPRILPLGDEIMHALSQGEIQLGKRNDNEAQEHELRLYQPTEDSRNIHWKASVKRNELMSKYVFDSEQRRVQFYIDTNLRERFAEETRELEDKMTESLVSVMSHLHERSYQLSLAAACGAEVDATMDFLHLYHRAAGLVFGEYDTVGALADILGQKQKIPTMMVLFLHAMDESIQSEIVRLAEGKHQVIVVGFELTNTQVYSESLYQAGVQYLDGEEVLL